MKPVAIKSNGLGFEAGLRKMLGTPPPQSTKPVNKKPKRKK
jgi:hypothetical protein